MLAKKKSVTAPAEKIQSEESMTLTAEESIYFKDEIEKQLAESKIIDIGKAVRNARYLLKIDRAIKNINEGRGIMVTGEELRRLIYGA